MNLGSTGIFGVAETEMDAHDHLRTDNFRRSEHRHAAASHLRSGIRLRQQHRGGF